MIIKECCNHSNTARKANNMNEIINNWDLILNTFKNECDIQNLSFTTFIKPLQVISVSDNEITLLSDTQMSANYVEKRYLKFLEVTISEIMKKDYKLRIISEDTLNEENRPRHSGFPGEHAASVGNRERTCAPAPGAKLSGAQSRSHSIGKHPPRHIHRQHTHNSVRFR